MIKSWSLFLGILLIGAAIGGYVILRPYLIHVDFSEANLKEANFTGRFFHFADFSGANLSNAKFTRANLYGTDFSRANLTRANLYGADFTRATLDDTSLTKANLSNGNFWGAVFGNADLSGADLSRAYFGNSYFGQANFTNTYLIDAKRFDSSDIKLACYWEKAIYKGHYDNKKQQWIIDKEANQQYIEQLKKDKDSAPTEPVNCSKWE